MPDRFRCQTSGCGQPFRIVTLDVETSETEYECFGCWLAKALAVLRSLGEQGLLDGPVNSAQPE